MGGSTAPNPQVEVTVTELTTTTASVEFQSSGAFTAPVGINVNGSFEVTSIIGSGTGNGVSTPCGTGTVNGACSGSGNTSNAGTFNYETSAVNNGTITIFLTAMGGTTWADALAVLAPNSNGWEAADNMSGSPQDLGFAPIPAALPLFATGLGALGLLGWRRKQTARSVAV
jgi:hypothetical protein